MESLTEEQIKKLAYQNGDSIILGDNFNDVIEFGLKCLGIKYFCYLFDDEMLSDDSLTVAQCFVENYAGFQIVDC